MCGIAGLFSPERVTEGGANIVRRMTECLAHRGPDADGLWSDDDHGVWLGHRRLSIVDLSLLGRQPMLSPGERFVAVLNGEIYNYRALRRELETTGVRFRSDSDTEVALAAFETWGVQTGAERLVGMFAFAVWDRSRHELHLIRDRVGEKPLYFGRVGSDLVFASELKSLRRHPDWRGEVNREVLGEYLRFGYVPGSTCIYENVQKLAPGTIATFVPGAREPAFHQYWSATTVATEGVARPLTGDADQVADLLESRLRDTIADEMIADVPLGAFLSGGIDSSLIVALMQAQAQVPVRTFTIGFPEQQFNEAEYARDVARHLGTEHTEFVVTGQQALDVVPKLPVLYDEPFADHSQIPTHLVSALARRHVTVSLSGDGADELFGGYTRYDEVSRIRRAMGHLPRFARVRIGQSLATIAPGQWDRLARSRLGQVQPLQRMNPTGTRMHRLSNVLRAETNDDLYDAILTHWNPREVVIGLPSSDKRSPRGDSMDILERMMLRDLTGYLTDDILVKVDRAAMGVSLETRAPYLDHRVVELAWKIPTSMKFRDGTGKWILRRLLDRYVPRALVDRPKMGFGVPLASWLRGPLRDWAGSLLDPRRLRSDGFLQADPIRERWRQHLSGERDWQNQLWDVLMFQSWLECQN